MRTTQKISILTVFLLLFVSLSSFGQSRQDKTNAIINKLKLAQHQRMVYELQVKPLKYHATGNDSMKLVELEKELTDEHITKVISKSFDEHLIDEEVNEVYNFVQSSTYEKFFHSGELADAVSVRLGMFDEEIEKAKNNLKDTMTTSISTFATISIDREDKANVIINKMKMVQAQRMRFEAMVRPLMHHATGNDSVKLVELEKQLTDEYITKVINDTFDELLSDEEINDIYNFTKTSIYKRLFESGEINDAVSARLGMLDIKIKNRTRNIKDALEQSASMFEPIPIDREDGFYVTINYNLSIEDKDVILEENAQSLTLTLTVTAKEDRP